MTPLTVRRLTRCVDNCKHAVIHRFRKSVRPYRFTDRELWGLDSTLSGYLGDALARMADMAHGHPGDRTFEEWVGQLRGHGAALTAYAEHWDAGWAQEGHLYIEAQAAYRWVADNLGALWD